jgi:hypothetical protein
MKPKWQKPLTKKEIAHIQTVAACRSLKQFKRNVEGQNEMRLKTPGASNEPCWECRTIARKLGLEVK